MHMARKARLVGINHVALEVGDLDEALEFYGRIFDIQVESRIPGMAFVTMGDQFLALAEGRTQPPDDDRHFGLVVDDKEAALAAAREAGVDLFGKGNDFRDPWGNFVQVVEYSEIQFTKAPEVLRGMDLDGIGKSDRAREELRRKGLV
jgi:lactoylglutathione lyase